MTVWVESEWDERAQTACECGVRADVFPDEYEHGAWSWTVKAVSAPPVMYDGGTADNEDAALSAAEASLAEAVEFYLKERP